MITKESLLAQKQKLQAQRDQLLAQVNATAGAIQQIDWLLSEFDAKETDQKEAEKD